MREARGKRGATRWYGTPRAPEREIDTLFDRYDQAVEAYMEELRRKAIEEGNIADAEGGGGQGRKPTALATQKAPVKR